MHLSIQRGWVQGVRRVESPNFEPRPETCQPELLVIHNISLPPGEYDNDCIERFFSNCLDWDLHPFFEEIRDVRVSAHFLIRRDGEIIQFVSCDDRAWHAGISCFEGRESCNDFSVGIELEGTDEDPYAAEQYASLGVLSRVLIGSYPGLSRERIAGHSDIAPGRKTDPGPSFDWRRYLDSLDTEEVMV